ncbi:MAG: tetratricopeptide repeat protein [Magnetococcales bacterium]|nr:tetratricopeptide repeat protein [Magnetococcales bacterium]
MMRRTACISVSLLLWLGLASLAWAATEIDEIYALADQKRFPEAMTRLDGYLQKNPKDAQGRFLKGLILTEQKRPEEAIAVFKALSVDHPSLPEPYNNLAVLYAEKGLYEEASESLKKAIQTHPSYATAHENLGDIYSKMASQAYSKALALDSQNRGAQTKLDMIRKLFALQGGDASTASASGTSAGKGALTSTQPNVAAVEPVHPSQPASAPRSGSDVKDEIERSINQWAKDWADKNARGYLDAYSSRFKAPAPFPNRAAWEASRKQTVEQTASIRVNLSGLRVTIFNPLRAQAVFKQDYWSPTYSDKVRKTLSMVLEDGRWKILRESSTK